MSRSQYRTAEQQVGLGCVIFIVAIPLLIILFVWQRGFLPHDGVIQDAAWWKGFVQGFFAGFNFLFNLFSSDKSLDIYQTGASGWYQLWFFIGLGFAGGGAARSSR